MYHYSQLIFPLQKALEAVQKAMEEAIVVGRGRYALHVESFTEEEDRYFILLFTEHLQQPVLVIYSLPFKITLTAH